MPFEKLSLALLWAVVVASPHLNPQVSLPTIPSMPGVTVPLASAAPPGIILQPPTPALPDSDPNYTPSDIQAKKIGFFFASAGDNEHADFLASYSLDDDTFGTLLRVVDLPTSGNSPHHLGWRLLQRYVTHKLTVSRRLLRWQSTLGRGPLVAAQTPEHGVLFRRLRRL